MLFITFLTCKIILNRIFIKHLVNFNELIEEVKFLSSFKIILIGPSGAGKTSFLKYCHGYSSQASGFSSTTGASFSVVKYLLNDDLICKFQLWDVHGKDLNKDTLVPSHCEGASGCLLFFDTSNSDSFSQLKQWIKIVRKNAGKIPIMLIGTKTDLEYQVSYEEIKELVKKHRLDGFYLLSIRLGFNKKLVFRQLIKKILNFSKISIEKIFVNNIQQQTKLPYGERRRRLFNNFQIMRADLPILHFPSQSLSLSINQGFLNGPPVRLPHPPRLPPLQERRPPVINEEPPSVLLSLREEMLAELERLRQIMRGEDIRDSEEYISLSEEEKEIFDKFLEYFSTCPMCKEKNHVHYLKRFYFSPDPCKVVLRERLLKLIDESQDFDVKYYQKINLGIVCCDCFKKVFESPLN